MFVLSNISYLSCFVFVILHYIKVLFVCVDSLLSDITYSLNNKLNKYIESMAIVILIIAVPDYQWEMKKRMTIVCVPDI